MIVGRNLGSHGFLALILTFVPFLVSDSLGFSIADNSLMLLHALEQYKSCHHSILFCSKKKLDFFQLLVQKSEKFLFLSRFLISKQNNLPAVDFPQPQNKLKH
jgi:hypothetical protein